MRAREHCHPDHPIEWLTNVSGCKAMQEIRDALLEVSDLDGIIGVDWSWEDVAYQEIGDSESILLENGA